MYKEKVQKLLEELYGKSATFREGQLEAILSVLNKNRTLVVQKTGWGKSLVYFLSTKILREEGMGITIIISPLLSLVRNQLQSAQKLGLVACSLNSSNQDEWDEVYEKVRNDKCDILMIAPERLGNKEHIEKLLSCLTKGIGLFVIDEAHCISEWGHDFRPDFLRINKFINNLTQNVPILATTATANNRVIEDIKQQFSGNIKILRGNLLRESLKVQIIKLSKQEERLAWLAENIPPINGSGIIYCLTKRDCILVTDWLKQNGISAEKYYSDDKEINRLQVEDDFYNNKFKVIVSTVALGMGYDKPDIKFVIHFQRPASLLAYYQQIGRAGRSLDEAYAIMLVGEEDEKIQNYFINTAFPTRQEMEKTLNAIEEESEINKSDILKKINIRSKKIEQCLKFLEILNVISKDGFFYSRTLNPWNVDIEFQNEITNARQKELQEVNEYISLKSCYMEYISQHLNDISVVKCNKCANCSGKIFSEFIKDEELLDLAKMYIKEQMIYITPRAEYPNRKRIPKELRNEIGFALCSYGDTGWGLLVKNGKYIDNYFSDELVQASYDLLKKQKFEVPIDFIVYVPSLNNPELVKSFAKRLAQKINIPCFDIIEKIKLTQPQKTMKNSVQQYNNICDCFSLNKNITNLSKKTVLLIDDVFDSKWTLTVCGIMLKEAGIKYVYPYTLASTTSED